MSAHVRWLMVAVFFCAFARAAPASVDAGTLGLVPNLERADLAGRLVDLRRYRGKLVLLNFWATWCGPCVTEIPRFVTWQQTYGSAGLQIIGVSMDDRSGPVRRFYQKYHLNYPVVMGDAALAERFGGVLGLPLSYLIGPDGRIIERYQGELDLEKMDRHIKLRLPRQ